MTDDPDGLDESRDEVPASTRCPRWRRPLILLVAAAIVLWALVLRPPSWWSAGGDTSPEAAARGVGFENAMVREVTLVREDEDPWGFVITDEDVNAWLANRLEAWLTSRGADDALAVAGDPRIRLVPGGVEIGVAAPFAGVVVARFEISIEGDELVVVPTGGGLGVVPIGAGPLSAGLEILAGAVDGIAFDPAEGGGLRLPRAIPLSDGRTVHLDDLELVTGELAVRFRTLGP